MTDKNDTLLDKDNTLSLQQLINEKDKLLPNNELLFKNIFIENTTIALFAQLFARGQTITPETAKRCWADAKMLWDNKPE